MGGRRSAGGHWYHAIPCHTIPPHWYHERGGPAKKRGFNLDPLMDPRDSSDNDDDDEEEEDEEDSIPPCVRMIVLDSGDPKVFKRQKYSHDDMMET